MAPSNGNRKALITGITGQDGSYLAELLVGKGYTVHGIVRRSSTVNTGRLDALDRSSNTKLFLHYGDVIDGARVQELLNCLKPDEVYHLAAQSHVKVSFDEPVYTVHSGVLGTIHLLEAIRNSGLPIRFYQASSSEMFGQVAETPQTELTPFRPRSPYACAKAYSFWQTVNYRQAYGMFCVNGILFNHESPRRDETFVTRKITRAATRIKVGLQEKLFLGNLKSQRDWGFAGDYVEAMWLMLQADQPEDYVIATGESNTVLDFVEEVFALLDLDWEQHVEVDPRLLRPAEVELLRGDASKARTQLGWRPNTTMKQLVRMMVESDLHLAEQERSLQIIRRPREVLIPTLSSLAAPTMAASLLPAAAGAD